MGQDPVNKLIGDLVESGYLKTDTLINAFFKIDRAEFVPHNLKSEADFNTPLPIGFGQTISQPLTVAFMLELLDLKKGQNVLDVGSGSGWTTALLSEIIGAKGKVTALEIVPELYESGKENVKKFSFIEKKIAEFYQVDGNEGFPQNAPYDRILVSAAAQAVPEPLLEQLKIGGKIVIPVKSDIWYLEKKNKDDFYKKIFPGFSFVPLIKK